MTLDDLGRAAYEAEWRAVLAKDREPPPYTDIDRPAARAGALAAVERFAEEAARELCEEADGYEADLTENGLGRKAIRDLEQLRMAAIAAAEKLGEMVASLRAEAEQGQAKIGVRHQCRVESLAAVERFAEAYCEFCCRRCRAKEPAEESQGIWWHDNLHYECYASSMRTFLASLRAEAKR